MGRPAVDIALIFRGVFLLSNLKIPKYNPPSFDSLKSQIPSYESFEQTVPTIEDFTAQMPSMDSYKSDLISKIGFDESALKGLENITNVPTIGGIVEKGASKLGINVDGAKIDEMQKDIDDFKSKMESAAFEKIKEFAESKGIKFPSIPSEEELLEKINMDNLENVSKISGTEDIENVLHLPSIDDVINNPPEIVPPSIDDIIQIPDMGEKLSAIENFIKSKLNS